MEPNLIKGMMNLRILTSAQMKEMEAAADRAGWSYRAMMEAAGRAAAAAILEDTDCRGRRCAVLCGRGNNGGDGCVAALRLAGAGVLVEVITAGGPPKSPEALSMYQRAVGAGLPLLDGLAEPAKAAGLLASAHLVVDGLLGTGFSGELREGMAVLCRAANGAGRPVYALDLPSGVNADTGEACADAISAHMTIAFDSLKPAHLAYPARGRCGRVACVGIGITPAMGESVLPAHLLVNRQEVAACLPRRPEDCHKGHFGRLLAVCGSAPYMGAALLAASAALRSGAGYVTLAAPEAVCPVLLPSIPECVMLPCAADEGGGLSPAALPALLKGLERATALLIGCGLGQGEGARTALAGLLAAARCPVILDADGINLAARDITIIKKRRCNLILTPHLAEFARLTGRTLEEVSARRLELGRAFAEEHRAVLLLKGPVTMVFEPGGPVRYIDSGCPGMAKGGSGDVLSGIIGSLLAQGLPPGRAAACGAWIHGRAGSLAAGALSQTAMLPRDIVAHLGKVYLDCGR